MWLLFCGKIRDSRNVSAPNLSLFLTSHGRNLRTVTQSETAAVLCRTRNACQVNRCRVSAKENRLSIKKREAPKTPDELRLEDQKTEDDSAVRPSSATREGERTIAGILLLLLSSYSAHAVTSLTSVINVIMRHLRNACFSNVRALAAVNCELTVSV